MPQARDGLLVKPGMVQELEIDAELFDEPLDTLALAGITADGEGIEPWQRLGDLLDQITGEVETE